MTVGINKKDTVNTFEEIGWFDPDIEPQKAMTQTMKWLKHISFVNNIYPSHLMNEFVVPSCVFVPSTDLLRKMIMAAARCHSTQEMREMFNAY
jgi:hypothetical protein